MFFEFLFTLQESDSVAKYCSPRKDIKKWKSSTGTIINPGHPIEDLTLITLLMTVNIGNGKTARNFI